MNKPKALLLKPEHKAELEKLLKSGMTPVIIAQRAKILLSKANGMSNEAIAEELGINVRTVLLWCNKYAVYTGSSEHTARSFRAISPVKLSHLSGRLSRPF